jgi:hypothetical protein
MKALHRELSNGSSARYAVPVNSDERGIVTPWKRNVPVEQKTLSCYHETEDWALEDPEGKSLEAIRKIRDDIKTRIADLVCSLQYG